MPKLLILKKHLCLQYPFLTVRVCSNILAVIMPETSLNQMNLHCTKWNYRPQILEAETNRFLYGWMKRLFSKFITENLCLFFFPCVARCHRSNSHYVGLLFNSLIWATVTAK